MIKFVQVGQVYRGYLLKVVDVSQLSKQDLDIVAGDILEVTHVKNPERETAYSTKGIVTQIQRTGRPYTLKERDLNYVLFAGQVDEEKTHLQDYEYTVLAREIEDFEFNMHIDRALRIKDEDLFYKLTKGDDENE